MTFITRRITAQLQSIDLAPLAAGTLRAFVEEGRHQVLLDDLLRVDARDADDQTETMAMIREKIRAELPTLLRLYRADKFLVNKIVAVRQRLLRRGPQRSQASVPRRVRPHGADLRRPARTDPTYAGRIDGLKRDLLARPELDDLARNVWSNTRSFIDRSASGETQVLQHHLAGMFVAAGEALAGDAELRGEINQGLVTVLRSFVADQKSGVSTFISDQVKSWDMAQLISLIEINIGRDLQYIRFNGSLIGGLAGLALYTVEFLLRLL